MYIKDWEEEGKYFYYLQKVLGYGKDSIREIVTFFGSAKEACRKSYEELEPHLKHFGNEKRGKIREKWNRDYFGEAKIEYYGQILGAMEYVPWHHPLFPEKLRGIPDAPVALFYKGKLPDPNKPALAIIGSRGCSAYGTNAARWFAEEMARHDVQVISGLARGIDGIAQKSAMDAGGESFGVLGCGADVCYPKENRLIYDHCIKKGGIISEYIPGTQPEGRLFPPRNRIISGLADAVLVVEAKERSGTLITVDMALDQGKDVFMLPGRVTDRLSAGCNRMIAQGAEMALSPEDLLEKLYGIRKKQETKGEETGWKGETENGENREEEAPQILDVLDLNPKSAQQLFEELAELRSLGGYPEPGSVMELIGPLMQLCMNGTAMQLPGGFYRLDDREFG
ncbi:MAG: DNA-processing protein DprA, partial [Lachnospiraceae bacterium]|nr:DNA-processing protein DprA [Lachnospiraceae bacterium]